MSTIEITAAVVEAAGSPFTLQPVRLEQPRPDEVLVRVLAAGICHTDTLCRDAGAGCQFPGVLGHEGAGVVESVGAGVTGFAPGDRVAMTFRSCGACRKCLSGHPAYCETMGALNYMGARPDGSGTLSRDGESIGSNFFGQSSFATYAIAYATNLVKVPETLPLHLAAPLGCGVQTGAGAIMRALDCRVGQSVVVFGGGTVGLSAVMAAAIRECAAVIIVEPMAVRRQLALEVGATHAIDPREEDVAERIRQIVPGGVDHVVDTTGRVDVLETGLAALGSYGALGLVGVPADPAAQLALPLSMFLLAGHRVIGIIEGDSEPATFIPELIALYQSGRFPFDRLVTTFDFVEINDAIAAQHRGECIKPVLVMEQP